MQHRKLAPPFATSDPWTIRIYTLGRFEVQVEGVTLQTEGKAQIKPLELLRALVLHGGQCVKIHELMRALWSRQGGNARGAFDVTLSRLRKLLKRPDALLIRDGELALNPRLCWLDLWHFERSSLPQHVAVDAIAIGALKSYQGIFLPMDADKPGSMTIRERLRTHFHAAVLHVGTHLERSGDWKEALQVYHHATRADPQAEDYYYREMLCQVELGLVSGVRDTYDRWRQRISEVFNTKPSTRMRRVLERADAARLTPNSPRRSDEDGPLQDSERGTPAPSVQVPSVYAPGNSDPSGWLTGYPFPVGAAADTASGRPWPVSIRTLGQFDLTLQDRQEMPPKGQRRPLDVLRAIVALGGRGVPVTTLIDSLWDCDQTAPRGAFDTALLRLRKLLARDDAVKLHDGKVTLNADVCWVDAWAFDRAAAHYLKNRLSSDAEQALALYRGTFLGSTSGPLWAAAMRERLSLKFRHIITTLGDQYEHARDWAGAASQYQRGIAVDGNVEDFYRRLIYCYWHMGQQTDAIRVYRRCCEALQALSQRCPSAATTALYRLVVDSPMPGPHES